MTQNLANPEFAATTYICNTEDRLGYVDFEHECYSRDLYHSYDGRRDYRPYPALIKEKKVSVRRQLGTLERWQASNEEISDQDLIDLVMVGMELCLWNKSHEEPRATARWHLLVNKAAEDRKAGMNRQGFEYWWPQVVSLVLKLDDLTY